MKKKLYSFITVIMILFVCVFAGACGDKYKNMEFKILYAYSAEAEEWHEAVDGILLNYNRENYEGEGDENSLVFDENKIATIYVKVVVENVKSKHIDSITVSFASLSNINFSSKRVAEGEIFQVPITGNVDTTIKLYENNSGKKAEMPFVVSRELESVDANLDVKPAIAVSADSVLKLYNLNNLIYNPENQTNQIGVTYTVEGIGGYNSTGSFDTVISKENAQNYVTIENGELKIVDGSFYQTHGNAYIIKIKATSIYHDGSENPEDEKAAWFDVYVVEDNISAPSIKFVDAYSETVGSEINIYENGGNYSTSTIVVDMTSLVENSKYANGRYTNDGQVGYGIVVYVLNENNEYEKYVFGSEKHQGGINGLIVENTITGAGLTDNQFKFSIVNRNLKRNRVRIAYEIEGLDFSFAEITPAFKEFDVVKGVVPTCITVNDALDLNSASGTQSAIVYGTTSQYYKGLELKLAVNPNEDPTKFVYLLNEENGLLITDEKGNVITSTESISGANYLKVITGSKIYIKFKNNITSAQNLIIKTLKTPSYYNGRNIDNTGDFIQAKYNLTKVVTANDFEFLASENGSTSSNLIVDAEKESNIFVKVYYNGVNLDASTVVLKSNNDQILFANGQSTTTLNDKSVTLKASGNDENGKYNIYSVAVQAPNGAYLSTFTMTTSDESIGLEKTAKVSSVYLIGDLEGLKVVGLSNNAKQFTAEEVANDAFNFAIMRAEKVELAVKDGNNASNTISSIKITTKEVDNVNFSTSVVSYGVISNSIFEIVGRVSGKTQALDVEIFYYVYDEENKVIINMSTHREVQIAVYDGIGNISTSVTKDVIGYVNLYYTEISSTEIDFSSYTANYGTPASMATFAKITETDVAEMSVGHASQIQVSVNNRDIVKNNGVNITFVDDENIKLLEASNVVLNNGDENGDVDFLNGKIKVELTGALSLEEISITITALRFGSISNVIANAVIRIATVDTAERIVVSGNDFVQTSDTSNELQLSFMNVADGGYDEVEFNAGIQFSTQASVDNLRF
ncbi:MAG: hypothetical protein IJW36_03770, partial [Clostridia bacterium]|nr:hypothetical protein [Clostridia bacterium]